MTSYEAAAPGTGTAGKTGPLPFDTDLVEPGVVAMEEWRPGPGGPAGNSAGWCAVGRKR